MMMRRVALAVLASLAAIGFAGRVEAVPGPPPPPVPMCAEGSFYDAPADLCRVVPDGARRGTVPLADSDLEGIDEQLVELEAFFGSAHGYFFVPTGVTGEVGVADHACVFNDLSFMYCKLDGSVYVGEEFVAIVLDDWGDVALELALAHEMTHLTQHRVGFPATARAVENQADCGAGMYARWSGLELAETAGFTGMLWSFAHGSFVLDPHGTPESRAGSFYGGFEDQNCDNFSSPPLDLPA